MEKTKPKNAVAAPGSNAPVQYRENPRTNEKIDAWIKANPDQFKFFDELPHERAVRKLVLNEVQKYERMQKMNAGIMQKLDGDPEAKQAYETLLKRVPEADRERATASIAKHVFALGTPRNDRAKTQSAGGGMRVWRIKSTRVKDLRLSLRRGAPVRRSSVELRAQPAKAARLCLSALKQPMALRCRRLK